MRPKTLHTTEEAPTAKLTSYKANYPNWGPNEVYVEKHKEYITAPVQLPFKGHSTYGDSYNPQYPHPKPERIRIPEK